LAKTRPIVTEAVQEFGENHLARYDLVESVIARSCGGLWWRSSRGFSRAIQ
jgi:hypothetical protein